MENKREYRGGNLRMENKREYKNTKSNVINNPFEKLLISQGIADLLEKEVKGIKGRTNILIYKKYV